MVEYLVVPQYFISASFIKATLQIHEKHVSEIYQMDYKENE